MARILIADDDAHIARVMSMWLNRHGHETVCAADGKDALELVRGGRIELVITDMNMPQLDGLGFIKEVRELTRGTGAGIPILLLTARCDQRALVQSLTPYGVSVYPKPFLPSQLVEEIDRLLGATPAASGAGPATEARAT